MSRHVHCDEVWGRQSSIKDLEASLTTNVLFCRTLKERKSKLIKNLYSKYLSNARKNNIKKGKKTARKVLRGKERKTVRK